MANKIYLYLLFNYFFMSKINKFMFDQDYSLKSLFARGTIWASIWFFFSILFNNQIPLWKIKIILLWIWLFIFLIWALLVKNKKKVWIDERILKIQWKAYAYAWSIWTIFLFFGWLLAEAKIFKIWVSCKI